MFSFIFTSLGNLIASLIYCWASRFMTQILCEISRNFVGDKVSQKVFTEDQRVLITFGVQLLLSHSKHQNISCLHVWSQKATIKKKQVLFVSQNKRKAWSNRKSTELRDSSRKTQIKQIVQSHWIETCKMQDLVLFLQHTMREFSKTDNVP